MVKMERESYSTPLRFDETPQFSVIRLLPKQQFSEEFEKTSVMRWFHVLPFGEITRNGITRVHDRAKMDSIVEMFSAHSMPLAIDFNHQSMRAEMGNGPLITAGIVVGLGIKDDGLWALGKFTRAAQQNGAAGNVNYCSPVIEYDGTDPVTKKKFTASLYNVALATNPALDGLQPIQFAKESNMADKLAPNPVADKPPGEGAPQPKTEAPQPPTADGTAALQLLCEAVGCKSVAELIPLLEANMEAVAQLLKGEGADKTVFCAGKGQEKMSKTPDTSKEQIAILEAQVAELTKQADAHKAEREAFAKQAFDAKLDSKIELLFKEGKLLKNLEAPARELFAKDWTLGEKMFDAQQVPMKDQAGIDPPARLSKKTLNENQLNMYSKLSATTVFARASEQEIIDEIIKLESEKN